MLARFSSALLLAVEGRLSLRIVVLATMSLFWIVAAMFVYMALFRGYHRLRAAYRARRSRLYQPAIELVLLEEPFERIMSALRPRRWGDSDIVQQLVIDNMRHLEGPPFETLRRAARHLGFIERERRALRARRKHRRGMAMEALGVMKAREGVVGILDILMGETMELKLVALRSLAAIGDPAVLPYFLKASNNLSPTMMVRLASLMMEFGPVGRGWVARLIESRPDAFTPRAMAAVLREVAMLEPDR